MTVQMSLPGAGMCLGHFSIAHLLDLGKGWREGPGYELLGTLHISIPGEVPWVGGAGPAGSFPSVPTPNILSFRAGSGFSVGESTTVCQPDAGADVGTQARQTGTQWDGSQSVSWPPSPAQSAPVPSALGG